MTLVILSIPLVHAFTCFSLFVYIRTHFSFVLIKEILQLSRVGELACNLRNHNHKTTKLQHKTKTMDNEKPKRFKTAHIAFVQKKMEGATGILVKPITWKIQQGKNLWD